MDSSWMDTCWYCGLLHPDGSSPTVEETTRIVDMIDDETQTLEEGRCDPNVPIRVMITKNGKASHCRDDCPLLFEFSL